jgi:hypothetical protein
MVKSKGLSLPFSFMLISSEGLILLFAWYFDRRSKRIDKGYHNQVMQASFVSMNKVNDIHIPPLYTKCLSKKEKALLQHFLKKEHQHLLNEIKMHNFEYLYTSCSQILTRLKDKERRLGVHLSMSIHIVESLALLAQQCCKFDVIQKPKYQHLMLQLFRFQLVALPFTLMYDSYAQYLHRYNIGICTNDVPKLI